MEYNFEKLEVYKLAQTLIVKIYTLLKKFPEVELFGLSAQIKRAIISVALNIAEGSTGRSRKDFARFINTAVGSLVETKAGLQIAVKLNFITVQELEEVGPYFDELFFKLTALKKALNKNEA